MVLKPQRHSYYTSSAMVCTRHCLGQTRNSEPEAIIPDSALVVQQFPEQTHDRRANYGVPAFDTEAGQSTHTPVYYTSRPEQT